MGSTLEELGWSGTLFSTLRAELLHCAGQCFVYKPCKKSELEDSMSLCTPPKTSEEYAVFLKWDENRVIESLFSAIRNSLAHSSFRRYSFRRVNYYYFENHDGYLKAAINIREETLLDWIGVIHDNPESVRQRVRNRK